MFITAVCVLFLIKLRWPKNKSIYDLYGILQVLRGSHLNNFQLKTLKLGWVALHSVKFQLKCLDFNLIDIRNSSQSSHVSAMGYRPFYSCVLSYLAMNASEAGGDLALIQN